MKRTLALVATAFVSLLVAASLAGNAGATTTKIHATSVETFVTVLAPPTAYWVTGDIEHVRGLQNLIQEASSSPYINGMNTVVANVDDNLVTGVHWAWGTFNIKLDAFDGGWAGTWTSRGAVGKGYGDLAGWQIKATFTDSGPDYTVFSPGT